MRLTRIEKRAIEASAIAPIIDELARKIGPSAARTLLREVNQREAFERGKASRYRPNGIKELVKEIDTWGDGGQFEMEVLEQTSTTFHFNVTRCPYFDKYKEINVERYGVEFSCCRDEPHARGFNPKLHLSRTKTLMEGEAFCDFRYFMDP